MDNGTYKSSQERVRKRQRDKVGRTWACQEHSKSYYAVRASLLTTVVMPSTMERKTLLDCQTMHQKYQLTPLGMSKFARTWI